MLDTVRQDLRYACRQLIRRPGFTAVAILSLALGIGGNTAVFGIVDSFVLRPFAFPAADDLLIIGPSFPKLSTETSFIEVLSPREYEDFRHARSFSSTAAFDLGNRNISGGNVPDRVLTALMIDDAFPAVGLRPFLGRGFTTEELQPNGPPAAVISHRLWATRFHADRSLVGTTIRVNGNAATLVGVMPPELLLVGTDLWIPWGGRADQAPRNLRQFSVIARLAPGVSRQEAEAELAAIAARVASDHVAQFPEYAGWRLIPTSEKYRSGEAITAFFEELARRVKALPGVQHAGLTSQFPPQEFVRMRVLVDDAAAPPGATLATAYATIASRGYFDALGIRLRGGRTFDERDRAGAARVVVVNDAFVSRHFGGRSPLGARIRLGDRPEQAQPAEVVGVVANTANVGAASAPAPEVFVPMEQGRDSWNQLFLVAKIAGDPMSAVPAIRQAVVSLDPDQPVYAIQTLDQAFEASLLPQQVSTVLLTIFAAVALVLAGVGIYGVTAHAVRSRTQEIGIRMAMGADRSAVIWMVLREVLMMVGAGLAIGIGVVTALGPLLSAVLFGVTPIDPFTVTATAAVLGAVAVAAAWWPAAIASRVDPAIALRFE